MPRWGWSPAVLALTFMAAACGAAVSTSAPTSTPHVLSAITDNPATPSATVAPSPTGTIVAVETQPPTSPSAPPSAQPGERWKATMQTHSDFNIVNPSTLICQTVYDFLLDLLVAPGGAITGSGVATLTDVPSCPKQGPTVIVEKISFAVTGQMTSDGFTLIVTPTGAFDPAGSVDLTGMLVSLSGLATNNAFTVTAPFSDASHTLADAEFPRSTTAGSGIYTTENALVIVPASAPQ